MFSSNRVNGLKQIVESKNKESITHKIKTALIQLNFEFRNLRIRNFIILFIAIFSQVFFSTLLNIVILADGQSILINSTYNIFYKSRELFIYTETRGPPLLALVTFALLDIVIISSILCAFSSNGLKRKAGIYATLVHHSLSPLFYRFAIEIFLSSDKSSVTIISQVLGVLLIVLGLGEEILFWTISSTSQSKNINYMAFQRQKQMYIKEIINFVLVIIITIISHGQVESKIKIILLILHTIICFLPLYIMSIEFYYHNPQTDFIFHFLCCFEFTLAIMALIEMVSGEPLISQNMEIMTLILSILLLWGSQQFLGFRKQVLVLKNSILLKSTNELKIFVYGISQALQKDTETGEKDFIMNNLKNRHKEQCKDSECECHNLPIHHDKYRFENFLLRKELQQTLCSPFINLEVMLAICYFNLNYFSSFPDLLCLLNNFRKKNKFSNFEIFEYECFKYEVRVFLDKKRINANAILTERVQVQDEVIIQMGQKMHEISQKKFSFWGNLNKKQPDFEIIDSSIARQIFLIKEIDTAIPCFIEYFSQSKTLMELISLYEICIKMKSKMSKEIRKIFKNEFLVESEKIKIMKNQKFKLENIMFDKDAVIFESCIEKSNMGIIVNVSKNVFHVFGHYKQSIIGHNINEIMPKSMQKEHDLILESWRERASWSNIHKIRFVFAVTKESLCFETSIYVRIMQRKDSINLLATFVKANESDYMIVNDEGIIDGIGFNFIQLLGHKTVKLPFSMICNQSRYMIEQAKKNKMDNICTNFHHVKELDDNIEEYLYTKYNINSNNENNGEELERLIKNRSRSIQLTIEYKPYVMGTKFFLLIKIVEIHGHQDTQHLLMSRKSKMDLESEKVVYFNSSIGNNLNTSQIIAEQKEDNREASFQASQSSSYRENEKIFAHLEEKFLKAGNIKSSSIRFYFIGILSFSIITILFLMTQYIRLTVSNSQLRVEIGGVNRFVQKAEGLILVESRLQNIEIGGAFVDKEYEMERVFIDLNKIGESIVKENVTTWARFYKKVPSITKTMNATRYGKEFEILYDDYYSSYMLEALHIQKSMRENTPIIRENTDHNQINMKAYLERCFVVLENSIKRDLHNNWVWSIIKLVFIISMLFIFSMLLWKSKAVEVLQKGYVMKVLLSVNDFNCQQLIAYFKNVTEMLEKAISDNNKKNEAESIEKIIVTDAGLFSIYQNFVFEKDKFEHTKAVNRKMTKFTASQMIVAAFTLILLAGMIVLFVGENMRNEKYVEFINSYFSYITMEKEISYEFLMIRTSNLEEELSDEVLHKVSILLESRKENKQLSKLNTVFLQLIEKIKSISSTLNIENKEFNENKTLCQHIQSTDLSFYNHNCILNPPFPFARLRYFEANSIIEEYVTNVLSMIVENKTDGVVFEELYILEEVVTLKMLYRAVFLDEVSNWITEFRKEKHENFMRTMWLIVSTIVSIVLFSLIYSKHICSQIKNNCWSILVIPEMVLRNTKGAMRYIENVLSTLQ